VFYVNNAAATGSRYMEAAPSGWNTGADPNLTWGEHTGGTDCSIVNVRGAAGTAIGTGRANTRKITAACTTAWAQSFVSGNQFVDVKFFTVRVRPVRTF